MPNITHRNATSGHKTANSNKSNSITRISIIVVVGLGLFFAGWGVGRGTLSFSIFASNQTENPQLPAQLNYSSVQQVYNALRQNFDGELDETALLDGMKAGLARATGDPYTEFLNVEETKEFNQDLNGTFSGIGAELSKKDDVIVVVSPISGFPAEQAGLRAQDIITEIDGQSTFDMSLTEAVSKIRGESGTNVTLTVVRDGKEMEFTITRADITIPSVEYSMLDGSIGYIKISRFAEDTAKLTQQAATNLKQQGAKGIVLDLRSNPGGLLEASVDVSSLWLKPGTVVLEERRGGETIKTYRAHGDSVLQGVPTVVLINEGSASASEIVAGALSDNDAANLLGMKTFGKGSVQQLESIPSGGILKVTVARWYTPSGRNIDKEGIAPDQEVQITTEDYSAGRDPQKDAAMHALQNQ